MNKWLAGLLVSVLLFLATNSASAELLSGKIALTITTNDPRGSGWQDTQRDISLLDLATGSIENITRTPGEEMLPWMSPNSQEVLFAAFDSSPVWQIKKYSISEQKCQTFFFLDHALPLGWLDDSRFLAQVDFASVRLVDSQTKKYSEIARADSMPQASVISEDGKTFYFEYHNPDRYQPRPGHHDEEELGGMMEIRKQRLGKHSSQFVCDGREPTLSPDGKLLAYVYDDDEETSGVYLDDFAAKPKTKPKRIAGTGSECPRFSPCGKYLAYLDTRSYQKVDVVIIRLSDFDIIKRIPVGPAQGMDW